MHISRRFLKDRYGNFGILTALAIVPLIGAAGIAVDYGYELDVHTKLMGAADAAALGVIAEKSPALAAIRHMNGDGEVDIGDEDGKELFMGQRDLALSQIPLDVSVKVTKTGGDITSHVTFSAQVPTTFMHIFGQESVTVTGVAAATYGSESRVYTDFYMLLDNTPSMGIGATQADINKLVAVTANAPDGAGRNCAFACHMSWTGNDGTVHDDKTSNYYIARDNNVTLRIDVVAQAAKALMDDVTSMRTSPDQFRVAAYTFGKAAKEPGYGIERVSAPTIDMTTIGNAVGQIGLMSTDHHGYNEDALTSFDTALTEIGKEIKTDGGNGTGTSDRETIVFFVTDGLGDSRKPSGCTGYLGWANADRCLEPVDLKYCTALKNRNIKIAVLYTTYLPLTSDAIWNNAIKPKFANLIGPRLQQCASDDLYFEVKPGDDMTTAMSVLFSKAASAQKNLRLTK
jgi:hypothetical protein